MSIAKIQTGDQVKVIAGNYKGNVGQVLKVVKRKSANGKVIKIRAAVSNVPKIAKYRRSTVVQGQSYPGMKTETDRFIDLSNLSLVTSDQKYSKVKIALDEKGKKIRVLKKTNETVVKQILPKIKPATDDLNQ